MLVECSEIKYHAGRNGASIQPSCDETTPDKVQNALTESSVVSRNSRDHPPSHQDYFSATGWRRTKLDGKPPQQLNHLTDSSLSPPQRLTLTRCSKGVSVRRAVPSAAATNSVEAATVSKTHMKVEAQVGRVPADLTTHGGSGNHAYNGMRASEALRSMHERSGLLLEMSRNKFPRANQVRRAAHSRSSKSKVRHTSAPPSGDYSRSGLPGKRFGGPAWGSGNDEDSGKSTVAGRIATLNADGDSKLVVLQSDTIRRDGERVDRGAPAGGSKVMLRRGRALPPSDYFWQHERQMRPRAQLHAADAFQRANADVATVPQLLTEHPALPQVLEAALADHYLASLMTCPASETERILSVFTAGDAKEVLNFLRRTYGCGSAGTLSNGAASLIAKGPQQQQETARPTEAPSRRRRKPSGTVRTIRHHNVSCAGESPGFVSPPPKHFRAFLKHFTAEVCMSFMDEVCILCRARSDRVWAESRALLLPEEAVVSHYEQEVSSLLTRILAWTEKEFARVVPVVARLAKQYLFLTRREGGNVLQPQ
ncbi:hypothetical protein, conserved [Trypanosoma brucei gambiense DAL972]|uniref:Uncharacterized protein n=1 Tax=Trypanosoma brucei gambiense (strain MHOM/CI/86/DAL972) TaxID=679716 RepID=C9ZU34_TRYB9|nr:hypothetical protein, conserved [Trypanosoma brucei gambiense DAL972]CBH12920.1 hypothetical protein, conserved [Trypanosoma brucei gambiense DAL972]|eukprot:XP_011775199.1 hypothetical protein, conserved [Trypanosoma brucei gambiense DAL972]